MITPKGRHTPKSIIPQRALWYCAYSLSYRNIEEMIAERGIAADHSTLNRWVAYHASKLQSLPSKEEAIRQPLAT